MSKTTTLPIEKDRKEKNNLKPSPRTIAAILDFSAAYHVKHLANGEIVEMLLN
jgi:hypothetical protein